MDHVPLLPLEDIKMLNFQIDKTRKLNPVKFGVVEQGSRRRDGRDEEVSRECLCSIPVALNNQLSKININSCE